jgi:hypothetical protein
VEAREDVKFRRVPCEGVYNFAKERVLENDLFGEEELRGWTGWCRKFAVLDVL